MVLRTCPVVHMFGLLHSENTVRVWMIAALALTVSACGAHRPQFFSPYPEVVASIGAGFTGLSTPQVNEHPVIRNGALVTDSVDLTKDQSYQWRPGVSTGLVGRWRLRDFVVKPEIRSTPKDSIVPGPSFGLGMHMVFLSDARGNSRSAPATTFHLGARGAEFFVGWIWTSRDVVEFPPDAGDRLRIYKPAGTGIPNFIVTNKERKPHLFAGIELQGARVAGPAASRAFAKRAVRFNANKP